MAFHRHTYPIRTILESPIKLVYGWRLDNTEFGFHNNGKNWVATDLYSGLRICAGETRKECVKWISEHEDEIRDKMSEPLYAQRICEFRELLKKEIEEL